MFRKNFQRQFHSIFKSDGKIPKGFGNFFPKGGQKKNPAGKSGSSNKKSNKDEKASLNDFFAKAKAKKGKGGGGGGPKFSPSNEIQMLVLFFALAYLTFSNVSSKNSSGGTREINWQDFKNQLLASGQVERLIVANKTTVRVVMRRPDAANPVSQPVNNLIQEKNAPNDRSFVSSRDLDSFEDQETKFGHDSDIIIEHETPQKIDNRGNYEYPKSVGRGRNNTYSPYYFYIGSIESFERKLEAAQRELNIPSHDFVPVQYTSETNIASELLKFLPTLALLGLFLYMGTRGAAGVGGGGGMSNIFRIGKSNARMVSKDSNVKVSFKDVAGVDEAKREVVEFVDFLKYPKRFTRLGAKIPKGALLVGPPGTGKTLLAKAVAGEASVPFFSISGSDFIEMFVGVGPSRVRDLFKQARENAPCIVFIDEIDAVARARSKGGFSGGNDERENTLNQLLVEMDGFNTSEGVVVLAGTNRSDILDKAILRPGRFDRQIQVDKPDIKGRRDIFLVHMDKMKLSSKAADEAFSLGTFKIPEGEEVESNEEETVKAVEQEAEETDIMSAVQEQIQNLKDQSSEIVEEEEDEEEEDEDEPESESILSPEQVRLFYAERMASLTPGFAGADIANICNEAAIRAARKNKKLIEFVDFEEATDRVIGGLERKRIMSPKEKKTIAYHEAGHAITGWFLEHAEPLLKVTIVPRGNGALGYAQYLPREISLYSKEQMIDMMCMALGGRAAEAIMFNSVTTGASDDLKRVTEMAYGMVKIYGFNDRIGNISFPPSQNEMDFKQPYSDSMAQVFDEEAKKIVKEAYDRTEKLLKDRHEELVQVAELLLEQETINKDDIVRLIGERPFKMPSSYQDYMDMQQEQNADEESKEEDDSAAVTPEVKLTSSTKE